MRGVNGDADTDVGGVGGEGQAPQGDRNVHLGRVGR